MAPQQAPGSRAGVMGYSQMVGIRDLIASSCAYCFCSSTISYHVHQDWDCVAQPPFKWLMHAWRVPGVALVCSAHCAACNARYSLHLPSARQGPAIVASIYALAARASMRARASALSRSTNTSAFPMNDSAQRAMSVAALSNVI